MTSKIINTPKIFVLCIGIVLTFVPAVTAIPEHAGYSGAEVNKPTAETNYIILPAEQIPPDTGDPSLSSQSTMSITRGATKQTALKISSTSKVNFIEVDLKWGGVSSNSLSLSIADPSNYNLGTYRDESDGKIDERIHLFIYPSTGYIKTGTWIFKIYGESVSGTQNFSIVFYTH